MSQYRTHTCGEFRAADAGKTVTLAGWMENVREVGNNFAFVVLRDFYGTTQIVVDSAEMMKTVKAILAPQNSFMVLNLYSNGFSPILGETVVKEAFGLTGKTEGYDLESGELALRDRFGKVLPLSIFVRLKR